MCIGMCVFEKELFFYIFCRNLSLLSLPNLCVVKCICIIWAPLKQISFACWLAVIGMMLVLVVFFSSCSCCYLRYANFVVTEIYKYNKHTNIYICICIHNKITVFCKRNRKKEGERTVINGCCRE